MPDRGDLILGNRPVAIYIEPIETAQRALREFLARNNTVAIEIIPPQHPHAAATPSPVMRPALFMAVRASGPVIVPTRVSAIAIGTLRVLLVNA